MSTMKRESQKINLDKSLLIRATQREKDALETLARQFIPLDEEILSSDYLGVQGLWGLGVKSFMFITNRRAAALQVGPFGYVIYQDGYLEHLNSGVVLQKSRLMLFILLFFATMVSIILLGAAQTSYSTLRESHKMAELYEDDRGKWKSKVREADLFYDLYSDPDYPSLLGYIFTGALLLLAPLSIPLLWLFAIRFYYRFFKCGLVLWVREGISVYAFCNRGLMIRANNLYRAASDARADRIKDIRLFD